MEPTRTANARFPGSTVTVSRAEQAQLRFYIQANLVTVIGAAIGLVAIRYTLVRSDWMLVDAAAVSAVVIALLVVRRWLDAGRTDPALTLLAVAIWSVGVATTAITPFILPITTLLVILPVIVILPFLSRARLIVTSVAAVGVEVVAVAGAAAADTRVENIAPGWLRTALVLFFVPVVTALVLLNAWSSHLSLVTTAAELRSSRARVVFAADRERRRIERDLHDGAQQRLTATAIRLGLVRRFVERDPKRATELLDELDAELRETIGELRDLAHGIYPPLLGQRGLGEALQAAARRVPMPTSVASTDVGRYPPDVEAAVYFCCLEAMQNTVKHAGPGTSLVVTVGDQGGPWFSVVDDGHGFDDRAPAAGAGLVHMSDRIGAVGGTVTVHSAPGRGTTVRGQVPSASTDRTDRTG